MCNFGFRINKIILSLMSFFLKKNMILCYRITISWVTAISLIRPRCDWFRLHGALQVPPAQARENTRAPAWREGERSRKVNMAEAEASETTSVGILQEIFTSPLNLTLLGLCLFLLYKIVRGDKQPDFAEEEKPLPKMKKRDFTIAELKPYDGAENPRILMAVNGKVFDVTRGKKFYGPGNVSIT